MKKNNNTTQVKSYRLSDDVIARIVQIIIEGFIMKSDVTDLIRTIVLDAHDDDSYLYLNEKYMEAVERANADLESRMKQKIAESNLIVNDTTTRKSN